MSAVEGADTTAAIRARLAEPCVRVTPHQHCWEEAPARAALLAVLDLCDQAPVNDDVGVMFDDEIEHAIAVALGLPGDPRHTEGTP